MRSRIFTLGCLLAVLAIARPAPGQTVTVSDPPNDSSHAEVLAPLEAEAPGISPPGWLDIVGAELSKADDAFEFAITLREPLPEPMPGPGEISGAYFAPGAYRELVWILVINTGDGRPEGYPYAPGSGARAEFFATVIWDGHRFRGNLTDRRPLLSGDDAALTPIDEFSAKGNRITLTLGAERIGDPASFGWGAAITVVDGRLPCDGYWGLDHAPDDYPGLANFPE